MIDHYQLISIIGLSINYVWRHEKPYYVHAAPKSGAETFQYLTIHFQSMIRAANLVPRVLSYPSLRSDG